MPRQGVGVLKNDETVYLQSDWYHHLTDAQLAAYIRYLFIYNREGVANWEDKVHTERRKKWDGGRDQFGTTHKSIWGKVVRLVRAADAHPGIWVAAHFSQSVYAVRSAQGKGVIGNRPELLCSDVSPQIYDDYIRSFEELTLQRYESAQISINTRFKIAEAFNLPDDDHFLLVVCDSSHVNASPFFRHAFSNGMNCERGMKRYIWPAAIEYDSHQPLYDKFIDAREEFYWLLTDDLKKIVAGIRKHWRQYDE